MPTTIATLYQTQRRGRLSSALWRVRQFSHALRCRPDPAVDAELRRLLESDAQWALLARLTPFDRAHHLRVHALLVEAGHDDVDLLRAALLHDVGKADERGRVNPLHRSAHVLLGWISPGMLRRVAINGGWLSHGLWLSLHHAENGAVLAARAGASERCCELIAAHAGPLRSTDPLLVSLAAADHASIR
jgi:putative nucleotidyltransferase with HDIG domain